MADLDAPGRQHLLDHAQTERKSEVQPDGMADDFSREAMTGIAGMARCVPLSLIYVSIPSPPG